MSGRCMLRAVGMSLYAHSHKHDHFPPRTAYPGSQGIRSSKPDDMWSYEITADTTIQI